MKNIVSKIKRWALPLSVSGAVALGSVFGCGPETKKGEYENYQVQLKKDGEKRELRINDKNDCKIMLMGVDLENDKRFDIIYLMHLPQGHPLEKYANPDSLNKIHNTIEKLK